MTYKYGEFSKDQIVNTKESMRKQIFFLLLCVDPETKNEYQNIDVNAAFEGLLYKFAGLNDLLNTPQELVDVLSLIKSAQIEFNNPDFQYKKYRKLILDAGNKVKEIKEV